MSAIDDIRQKLDIVDVISEFVSLHKAGRNFQALCPFHAEKTPSFIVSPERQTWHCFGACATGGDVFSFLMKKENLEFGEALRRLAQKAGVALPSSSLQSKAEEGRREKLYQATEAAAQFYQHQLHSAAGAAVRRYLEQRGLTPQTIEDFQLGFNPAGGPGLSAHLLGKGYPRGDLVAAGLTMEGEGGELRDRYPGRLIFPIRNAQGQVAGFGARALDDSMPKYINSPQTDIFDKSGLLYGLDRARISLRRLNQAIIVEGYMDVLMAHQYGFSQVVASMGTSLTEKQVRILKRFTKNIILALDADAAGTEATRRAHEAVTRAQEAKVTPLITPGGMIRYENILDTELKVLVPPQGKDPDEVIRESTAVWQGMVEGARPFVDFIMDTVASRYDLSQASGKSQAAQELLPYIAEITDSVRQAHYLQKLARLLGVDEAILAQSLKKRGRAQPSSRIETQPEAAPALFRPAERAEAYCLAALLQHPELRRLGEQVSPDYFESSPNREIFRAWRQAPDDAELAERLEPALLPWLQSLHDWPLPPATPAERERKLADALRHLKEMALRRSWQVQAAAPAGLEQLEQNMEPAQEMRQLFEQRGQRAKLGE